MLKRELKLKAKRCCGVTDFEAAGVVGDSTSGGGSAAAGAADASLAKVAAKEIAVKEAGRPKQRFVFDDAGAMSGQQKFADHECVPYCLQWGKHIAVAGNGTEVVFYDGTGGVQDSFDHSRDEPALKEFTSEFEICRVKDYRRLHLKTSICPYLWPWSCIKQKRKEEV